MRWIRSRVPPEVEILAFREAALESNALRAGAALGCSYTNSAEYEAALIAERRAAGAYAAKRGPWKARIAILVAALCVVLSAIVLMR